MKEKETIKSNELERINQEIFESFSAGDEPWIGGGADCKTITDVPTFQSSGPTDWTLDIEWDFHPLEGDVT